MSLLKSVSVALLFSAWFQIAGYAQPDYQLEFRYSPSGSYGWRGDFASSTYMTTAPNGTSAFPGFGESFTTFEDFQEAIVGQWIVTDFAFNEATFMVSAFSEDLFPQDVELINPMDGQDVISGVPLNYMVVSDEAEFFGIGVNFNGSELDVDFMPGQIMILTLVDGVNESFPLVRGMGLKNVEGLVSEIDDSEVFFSLSDRIRVVGESPIAQVRVVRTSIVGDVNLDGAIDLLDVSPFVEVLTSSGYQFEADIDGDGDVDLLDVSPFIELLQ